MQELIFLPQTLIYNSANLKLSQNGIFSSHISFIIRQMYKYPIPNNHRKDAYRPNRLISRVDDHERFSSFDTPPLSDKDYEEFSDYQSSREKQYIRNLGQRSLKKERSHILVEQLPLQYDKSASSRKKPNPNACNESAQNDLKAPKYDKKVTLSSRRQNQSPKLKQNCSLRYNYMQNIERHLSTIKEDATQELRQSAFSLIHPTRPSLAPKINDFNQTLQLQKKYGQKLYYESNLAILEKQKYQMLVLQQENISLKERIIILQKQLRSRDEERVRREAEIMAEKMTLVTHQDYINSTRKEAKIKLVEQVSVLQSKCRQMRQQMKHYKQKQQQAFSKIMKEKQQVKIQNIMLKSTNQYQAKFTEVFLNMIQKLPIDIEEEWSKKRKIAVGWKVIKHLVKKALKLGINPPAICQKQHQV